MKQHPLAQAPARVPAMMLAVIPAVMLSIALTACADPEPPSTAPATTPVAALPALEPPDGEALFRIACAGCHRLEVSGVHDVGPNLFGIVGQPAATRPGYAYSAALQAAGLSWDRGSLAAWIAATETLVPGTTMSYANILSGEEVARLLDYLMEAALETELSTE